MKPWSERSSAERAGVIGGVAAAVIALLFGASRLTTPPPAAEGAQEAAVADGTAAPATPDSAGQGTDPATGAVTDAGAADPDQTAADVSAAEPTADAAEADAAEADAAEADAAPASETAAEDASANDAAGVKDAGATSGDADTAATTEPPAEADGGQVDAAAVNGTEGGADATAGPTDADAAAEAPSDAPMAPEFDLVRVARDGSAVVAGSAVPGASVKLLLDGAEIGTVPANDQGAFVALFNLAPSAAPRILTMVAVLPDGTELAAAGRIAIAPTVAPALAAAAGSSGADAGGDAAATTEGATDAAAPAAETPAALLVTDEGTRILQSAGDLSPAMASNVTVDTITYTPEGAVQLSGRGTGGAVVRIYLDNAQVADTTVDGQGGWSLTLADIAPGLYTLRADQIGPDGQVTSRFETPFQRETTEALAAAAAGDNAAATEGGGAVDDPADTADGADAPPVDGTQPATQGPVSVTVQPGFTLWRIARENLGDGVLYVQVFEANKDQIRDPDLIYPGQVFAIPDGD